MTSILGRAEACVFGWRARHPYYVVAPPYHGSSAGNRALYVLCHALNGVGEEAYMAVANQPDVLDEPSRLGLRAPRLSQRSIEQHHQLGRTPVLIYPETFSPGQSDGVKTVYCLNYVGHLGGPSTFDDCDLLFGYSKNICRRTANCRIVLHIPLVDSEYWVDDANCERDGPAVYAGKYVDHHKQDIPASLDHARRIRRFTNDAPSRVELRDIFRTSTHLYIFENTSAAIEAILCGCPVVYKFNPFFDELISAQETGLAGFTEDDSEPSLMKARSEIQQFREDYMRSGMGFGSSLAAFIDLTQAMASHRIYDLPFRLEAPPP